MKTTTFLEALQAGRTLLADGGTGTALQKLGLRPGQSPEGWMLQHPEAVRSVAEGFLRAGSDLVYSNTFGGNRVRLQASGLEGQAGEINTTAARLAREAVAGAGRPAWVLGSIGPTGEMLEPYGELEAGAARAAFAEQASALAEGGVDALVCETFMDLNEALLALEAALETGLPVLASMAFEEGGRTMMGVRAEDAVIRLTEAGAAAAGANCGLGPRALAAVLRTMRGARPEARFLGKPNAGMPELVAGQTVYRESAEVFAEFAREMQALGAAVVGGCCGSTAEHLAAMRAALDGAGEPG